MHRKLWLFVAPIAFFTLLVLALYAGQDRLSRISLHSFTHGSFGFNATHETPQEQNIIKNGTILPASNITDYLEAIVTTGSIKLPRLQCPGLNASRYSILHPNSTSQELEYFFTLDLRSSLPILPTLIGSVVQAMRFLGPPRCALSIVEGNSPDGTADVLQALQYSIEELGSRYYFTPSPIDPSKGDRIKKLAQVRNLAMHPLVQDFGEASSKATVIFLNDVAVCAEDIIELIYQRKNLEADMTCAMDWTYVGHDPTFYDVWIARGINGDSFFNIPKDGSWDSAWNLFWNDDKTRSRFSAKLPFQVFSCWNGAVALGAEAFLDRGLRFRSSNRDAGECEQGEPQLFCKDMWSSGRSKIAVIPSVNLEYSVEKGKEIKKAKGFTSDNTAKQNPIDDKVEWVSEPPEKVRCMPTWDNQSWRPWNESLGV